jgi:hypothetical protein
MARLRATRRTMQGCLRRRQRWPHLPSSCQDAGVVAAQAGLDRQGAGARRSRGCPSSASPEAVASHPDGPEIRPNAGDRMAHLAEPLHKRGRAIREKAR